jgi:hypothetical protein
MIKVVRYVLGIRTTDGWEYVRDPCNPSDEDLVDDNPEELKHRIPDIAMETGISESEFVVLKETTEET